MFQAGVRSFVTGYRATTTVKVNLLDVNDNAPIFEKPSYNVRVKNTLIPGSPIFKVSKKINNVNQRQKYYDGR